MRKLMLVVFALVAVITPALQAEVKEASSSNYSTFENIEECVAAFHSGEDLTPYKPSHQGKYTSMNPVDGRTRVKEPLRAHACIQGFTMAGKKTVIIPEGMQLRWYADGQGNSTGVPYAMDWCGNPIYQFKYILPTPPPAPVVVEAVMGPQGPEGPMGPQGPPGHGCRVEEINGKSYVVCDDGSASLLPKPMSRGKKAVAGAAVGGFLLWLTGEVLCWW